MSSTSDWPHRQPDTILRLFTARSPRGRVSSSRGPLHWARQKILRAAVILRSRQIRLSAATLDRTAIPEPNPKQELSLYSAGSPMAKWLRRGLQILARGPIRVRASSRLSLSSKYLNCAGERRTSARFLTLRRVSGAGSLAPEGSAMAIPPHSRRAADRSTGGSRTNVRGKGGILLAELTNNRVVARFLRHGLTA